MDSNVKMRLRRRGSRSQLHKLVRRLLRNNNSEADTPVIISTMEGDCRSSVGRLLERVGARVSARVDMDLERERAVTVFLPEHANIGEVLSCVAQGRNFTVELLLIQYRDR